MKKKMFIILLIIVIFMVGILFSKRIPRIRVQKTKAPVLYSGTKGESDIDTIWCGTFQLAWNELINKVGKDIEFENFDSELVTKLNQQNFTKDMLSEDSYYIKVGKTTPNLKKEIVQDLKDKFGENKSSYLDKLSFDRTNGFTIYTALNKKFEFLEEFDDLKTTIFGNTHVHVRHFGIDGKSDEKLYKNVEILYYDWNQIEYEYAVKLKTKENEEIILANIISAGNFDEIYDRILELESTYEDSREFRKVDSISIPYVDLNLSINYEELCGKEIKGTRSMVGRSYAKYTILYES